MEEELGSASVREQLITAGIEELNAHGVAGFSLRRVAAACNISCAAPYKHFKNKEELIGAIFSYIKRQLEQHEGLNAYTNGAIRNAVKDIVGVQFRNMATLGGSIWGRFGFSDVLTVFLAMDCYVELYKSGIVPLEQFADMKKDNDILVRLIVKKTPGKVVYTAMRNQRTDFPVLTCALSNIGRETKAVIGARPAKAMVIRDKNGLLPDGKAFAAFVAEQAPTDSNIRGSAAYRTHLIRVLVERAAKELGGM